MALRERPQSLRLIANRPIDAAEALANKAE